MISTHPTDSRPARLAAATKTEEGRRWAESEIKALTGGDKISAWFMRQDCFEIHASIQADDRGQSKAGPTAVDVAIRRRIHLI
jgi:putative DNA primase/helicase